MAKSKNKNGRPKKTYLGIIPMSYGADLLSRYNYPEAFKALADGNADAAFDAIRYGWASSKPAKDIAYGYAIGAARRSMGHIAIISGKKYVFSIL